MNNYGNPYYYDDGFSVQGIPVTFDYELSSEWNEMKRKENSFLAFIKFTAPIDIMVPFKVEDRIILPVNKHQ